MNFAFTEEQEDLREAARAFLADHSSGEQVRHAMETEHGFDPDVWKRVGAELGFCGVTVPEKHGGIGLGSVELTGLMEVMGEHLLCAPFFSTVCLAGTALRIGGDEAQKQEHLPALAAGQKIATLAHSEAGRGFDPLDFGCTAEPDGADFRLRGTKRYVIDGGVAELLIVAARAPGSDGEAGVSLFLVSAGSEGVTRRPLASMDQTRRQAEIRFDDVRVPASARLGGEGQGADILCRTLDLAAVALAAEQVGGAQRCLDLSVAYAKEREQFGRPIGSFQAIKHKCADMMLRVESARSAAYYAACAAADDATELPRAASLAKVYCSEAYFACAGEAIQIHGGVGFTWEYDPHVHFKRAQGSSVLLGDPAYHRERIARELAL
ncbi:MAG: acyl-CoA/acyl-ACP dehydrogenase [Planctomycetota bacterium]|nr:acyl-CoA/acyl-ACP dehydrogenase [Planctomycetota bacterium]